MSQSPLLRKLFIGMTQINPMMLQHNKKMTAVILAATEKGGMGDDYFENKTRHLIPIAGKPLIQHLIETADECEQIRDKYIITEEKVEGDERRKPSEEVYNSIFGKRIGNGIGLIGEDLLTQVGTFAAVKKYIDEDAKKDVFPILVLYGDTLVEKEFFERVVAKYYNGGEKEGNPRIVWGLIETKNGEGNVYCTKQEYHTDENGFFMISGEDICDCALYSKKNISNNYLSLYNTGILIISEGAWDSIYKLIDRIHRPSPHGLFTFEHIIKQALVFKNIKSVPYTDIDIIGVVAPTDRWHEANYPWEMLELNKTKILDLVIGEEWTSGDEKEIGKKTLYVPKGREFTTPAGARITGPCILGKNIEIQDYAIIGHSYIGDECKIGYHAVIHDSALGKGTKVQHDAIIENSIIMEDSEICYHAEVLHSIVGEDVLIGSDVKTPCQRLKDADDKSALPHSITYISDIGIKRTERFGAIIGDHCQIGSGTVIHPGRRVGKWSKIHANCEILNNVKPHSHIRNKNKTEVRVHD